MAKTDAQAHALISLYKKEYERRFGTTPILNTYVAKYVFQAIIVDNGFELAQQIIHHYLSLDVKHTINNLANKYHLIAKRIQEQEQDDEQRQKIREQTRKRVEEWHQQNQK